LVSGHVIAERLSLNDESAFTEEEASLINAALRRILADYAEGPL
jgi:hypothetical protein